MVEAMSKKEKLARGSAVIKVMKVIPRGGHFLKSYMDVHKMPRKPKGPNAPRGVLAEMPWLDVKPACFELLPMSARIEPTHTAFDPPKLKGPCDIDDEEEMGVKKGLPDGHIMLKLFGYREWVQSVSPTFDGNVAEHFNILLGLIISMAIDPENANFVDTEAYPCIQFLKTIKTPEGEVPRNVAGLIFYIEFVCQKMLDEG